MCSGRYDLGILAVFGRVVVTAPLPGNASTRYSEVRQRIADFGCTVPMSAPTWNNAGGRGQVTVGWICWGVPPGRDGRVRGTPGRGEVGGSGRRRPPGPYRGGEGGTAQ